MGLTVLPALPPAPPPLQMGRRKAAAAAAPHGPVAVAVAAAAAAAAQGGGDELCSREAQAERAGRLASGPGSRGGPAPYPAQGPPAVALAVGAALAGWRVQIQALRTSKPYTLSLLLPLLPPAHK